MPRRGLSVHKYMYTVRCPLSLSTHPTLLAYVSVLSKTAARRSPSISFTVVSECPVFLSTYRFTEVHSLGSIPSRARRLVKFCNIWFYRCTGLEYWGSNKNFWKMADGIEYRVRGCRQPGYCERCFPKTHRTERSAGTSMD